MWVQGIPQSRSGVQDTAYAAMKEPISCSAWYPSLALPSIAAPAASRSASARSLLRWMLASAHSNPSGLAPNNVTWLPEEGDDLLLWRWVRRA